MRVRVWVRVWVRARVRVRPNPNPNPDLARLELAVDGGEGLHVPG